MTMNAFQRRLEAGRLAAAIHSTADRYTSGMISRETWHVHLGSLVAQTKDKDLVYEVIQNLMEAEWK